MFKSLTVAAADDKERAAQMGIELISVIDKACSRGVIHPNNAARKKSRVTSIVELSEGAGKPKGPATRDAKGQSKADKRGGRAQAKVEKKAVVTARKKAKAETGAKAAKAKPKKAEAEEAAADEAPVEEAASEEVSAVEPTADESVSEAKTEE